MRRENPDDVRNPVDIRPVCVARVTEELGIGKLGDFVRKETDSLQSAQ
jgi:hypothetical protein